jgi:hypothetical protein
MRIVLIFRGFRDKTKIFKFFLFLLKFLIKMLIDEVPLKLSLIFLSWRRYNLGSLLLRFFCGWLSFTFNFLLFLGWCTIMTEVSVDHVGVNVRVWIKTSAICWIRQTISLLFFVLSLFSSFLAYFLNLFDLIFSLKVFLFNFSNAILILLFERFKFIHAHIHDIICRIWIYDHLTQIRWKLLKINVIVRVTAHPWTHGIELLLRHVSHNSGWISILFSDLSLLFKMIHSFLKRW